MWNIDVATLFMMWASAIMNMVSWYKRKSSCKLFCFLHWAESESEFFLFTEKKEKQLGKISINQKTSKISLFKLSKEGKIPFS